MSSLPRAAVAQVRSTSDKLHNLAAVAKCAGIAKKEGASMLFLPEMFGFMGRSSSETLKNAEPPLATYLENIENAKMCSLLESIVSIHSKKDTTLAVDDNTTPESMIANFKKTTMPQSDDTSWCSLVEGLRTIARASNLWISGGGLHESGAPPSPDTQSPRVYNTHILVDNAGAVITTYRKIHLFDVSIPDKNVQLRESATTAPGSTLIICENTPLGRLGLTTCYDVRFPELYLALAKRGVDVVAVPAAFTVPTGQAHWHVLLRARAIEMQCFVIAAAQCGRHNEKRESYGHSLVVDPWGEVLGDAGGEEGGEMVLVCDVDLGMVKRVRERMPVQDHRESAQWE